MILLLSTSDTDLLSARASGAGYRLGNPARLLVEDLPALLDAVDLVVVRILGGRRAWEEGLDAVRASGMPVVALGGEMAPDAELMECSTVPGGVAADAHNYLAAGGAENLRQLHNFLSDTVLLTGHGFEPAVAAAELGRAGAYRARRDHRADGGGALLPRPAPGREHRLCRGAVRGHRGRGRRPLPLYCASLRTAEPELIDPARRRRPGGHGARRGRHPARHRLGGRRRRGLGHRRTSPLWTCRSCRACA